jgi:predicted DNA-binding transcriptional regulator YafY
MPSQRSRTAKEQKILARAKPRWRSHATARPASARRVAKPTLSYQMPSQVTQIAFWLVEPRSRSLGVDEIRSRLGIEEKKKRNVQRYLAGLRIGVFNGTFHPSVLRLEDKNGNEIPVDEEIGLKSIPETRIARARLVTPAGDDVAETPVAALLPIYMAFAVLRYLDGIIPTEQISELWRDLSRKAGPSQSVLMTGLDQKFFSVPYAPKRYEECQEVLAGVLDAVVRQHVLQVRYYGLTGEGKDHRFEPFTLAMYKGGLYVVGKSDRHDGLIVMAIERIDQVEKVIDEAGEPVRFQFPPGYSPAQRFQGVFGIIDGPETEVEIEIQNAETEARLRERVIHPSQVFRKSKEVAPDGYHKQVLAMRVRGTTELAMWILSHGPYIKVLKPRELREEVEGMLSNCLGLYGKAGPGAEAPPTSAD